MASEREPPTATDYVVTALSPILIMLMVGSLVFFLVEVLYEGKYSGRLLYTLFFFVLGAVLVARIAIETDATRASTYGLALGIATYLALLSYVDYPGGGWLKSFGWLVNLGLMLLIWWSAHKLTCDCTHLDEKRKGAGRGLLSAAGLDVDAIAAEKPEHQGPKAQEQKKKAARSAKKRRGKKIEPDSKLWDWIERYKAHREAQRNGPHTPGVWVIYFALAALPLFALGQSLVDPGDDQRRRDTFLQMVVYVGSALALLVTTSFLGLRRYLRQRKAKIPVSMTVSWLGFGGVLVVLFLTLGAFLPRPHSEVPWFGIARAGKSDRDASQFAFNKSSAGKGEGARGDQTQAGRGNASGKNGEPGGRGKGNKGSGGKGSKGSGKSDQNGKSGGNSDSRDENNNQDKTGEKSEDDRDQDDRDKDDTERAGKSDRDGDESRGKSSGKESSSEQTQSPNLNKLLEPIARLVKWIVFAIVALLVVTAIAIAILRYLAPFTDWARRLLDALRNWWQGLFVRRGGEKKATTKATGPAGPVRPPPFHEFPNPFTDGSADRRDEAELVDYTFLALDSWAWDQDSGRDPNETPREFCERLAAAFPELAEVLERFAAIYARMTYSELPLPADTRTLLEAVWEGLVHGVVTV